MATALSFIVYRFIRVSRRLKPFDSPQLDVLAERMGVLGRLNKKNRYFLSSRPYSAFSFPGGIAFGKPYWDHLHDGERIAIAAHEFSHTRSNDVMRRFARIGLPSLAITLAIMVPLASLWDDLLPDSFDPLVVLVTLAVFLWVFAILNLLNASWRRSMELKCDIEAARYTNGEDLISALSLWEGAVTEKVRKTTRYRLLSRYYPSIEERTEAIRNVTGKTSIGMESGNLHG